MAKHRKWHAQNLEQASPGEATLKQPVGTKCPLWVTLEQIKKIPPIQRSLLLVTLHLSLHTPQQRGEFELSTAEPMTRASSGLSSNTNYLAGDDYLMTDV